MKPMKKDIQKIADIDLEKHVTRKPKRRAEENVKIKIVVPLLELLGYDKVEDLDFEHRVRNNPVDIAIELDGKPRVSIECKDLSESLDNHLEQAFKYACWNGFMLLVLTNGKEIRVYKTWEVSSDLEDRILFSSDVEDLPKTFFQEKGLWDRLSKQNMIIQSRVVDKWKESQTKLPMMESYIDGLFDDVALQPDKEKILKEAFELAADYKYSEGIDLFRKGLALEIAESEKLSIHLQIGLCFYAQSRLAEAHGAYKEAMEISEALGEPRSKATCMSAIGLVYAAEGSIDEALEYHREALSIYQSIGDRQGQGSQMGNIGLLLFRKGDIENAFACYRESLAIHTDIGDKRGEVAGLINLGNYYGDKGQLCSALDHFQRAKDICRKFGFRQERAAALGGCGIIHRIDGRFDEALECFFRSLETIRKIDCRQDEATGLCNIGITYREKGEQDTALEYIQMSLEISRKFGYKREEANALGYIGIVYTDKEQFDDALDCLLKASAIFQTSAPGYLSINMANIAAVYFKKKCYGKAFEFLARAISSSKSPNQFEEAINSILSLAGDLVSKNDWGNLKEIRSAYVSGATNDPRGVDFFTCFYEYAAYRYSNEESQRKVFEQARARLGPVFRKPFDQLIERKG